MCGQSMPNCTQIDPLVTPYVDGELPAADRALVTEHVRVCAPCHSRVVAEQAVRTPSPARQAALTAVTAPESLRVRCSGLADRQPRAPVASAVGGARAVPARARAVSRTSADDARRFSGAALWRTRL